MQVMDEIEPTQADECFRCGYALRGIADDQACPECGLLAERSRRVTDELHDTRPKWLRKLAIGTWMILLSIAIVFPWAGIRLAMSPWISRQFFTMRWGWQGILAYTARLVGA